MNQTPPWVNSQLASRLRLHHCRDFANPWGPTLGPAPSGNPKDLILPNAAVSSTGLPLFAFADYNRANKLPYTMNQTLDIQWQPRNDLVIQVGYVGNLGRHEVVPLPFNQARIASPTHPIRPGTPFEQDYTYGYSILSDPSTSRRHSCRTGSHTCKLSKAETSTCAFPTLAIPPSRSPIRPPASPPTTRFRRTLKSA